MFVVVVHTMSRLFYQVVKRTSQNWTCKKTSREGGGEAPAAALSTYTTRISSSCGTFLCNLLQLQVQKIIVFSLWQMHAFIPLKVLIKWRGVSPLINGSIVSCKLSSKALQFVNNSTSLLDIMSLVKLQTQFTTKSVENYDLILFITSYNCLVRNFITRYFSDFYLQNWRKLLKKPKNFSPKNIWELYFFGASSSPSGYQDGKWPINSFCLGL